MSVIQVNQGFWVVEMFRNQLVVGLILLYSVLPWNLERDRYSLVPILILIEINCCCKRLNSRQIVWCIHACWKTHSHLEAVFTIGHFFKLFWSLLMSRFINLLHLTELFLNIFYFLLAHNTSVPREVTEALFVFHELIKFVNVTVVIIKNPGENWILAQVIETATTVLIDQ